jgi:hypothetical protein
MDWKYLRSRLLTPGLRKFSNIHRGESCYIFGNGASIKWFDLSAFADRPGICCGMIPFHKDFDRLDIRYVTLVEPWAFVPDLLQPKTPYLVDYRRVLTEFRHFIESRPDKEYFINLSNVASTLRGPNIHYVFRGLPRDENATDRRLRQFDVFGGSFHACVALAYFLGFTTIYLVGFDAWTVFPVRNLRFYEYGHGELTEKQDPAADFLAALREVVDIRTVCYDGTSHNVKTVRYEEFTGRTPHYQENHELIDARRLEILASYPLTQIYPPAGAPSP